MKLDLVFSMYDTSKVDPLLPYYLYSILVQLEYER